MPAAHETNLALIHLDTVQAKRKAVNKNQLGTDDVLARIAQRKFPAAQAREDSAYGSVCATVASGDATIGKRLDQLEINRWCHRHRKRAESPNALKLSDCPARRDGCAGDSSGARSLPTGSPKGGCGCARQRGGAAGVTRGAVRSSAWLGVAVVGVIVAR